MLCAISGSKQQVTKVFETAYHLHDNPTLQVLFGMYHIPYSPKTHIFNTYV